MLENLSREMQPVDGADKYRHWLGTNIKNADKKMQKNQHNV
jgi:hypothetical protein